jgi:hypothetical protein
MLYDSHLENKERKLNSNIYDENVYILK